jgi:hypothetical protein
MNLDPYIEGIRHQLEGTAEAGDEQTREVTGRLVAPLESAIRLALQDALAAAVEEITVDLAPGSVELRLRGRDPEFVVTLPPADPSGDDQDDDPSWSTVDLGPGEGDGGTVARINLRMPDHLKARVERAADGEGLSVNAWLVRAAARTLERGEQPSRHVRRTPQGPQRYSGWAR